VLSFPVSTFVYKFLVVCWQLFGLTTDLLSTETSKQITCGTRYLNLISCFSKIRVFVVRISSAVQRLNRGTLDRELYSVWWQWERAEP